VVKDQKLSLEQAREQAQAIKSRPPFSEAILQVNPKIDRTQRRLQCSLRFADFFDHLAPKAPRTALEQPQVLGEPLPRHTESAPRQFSRE
jgi:hypothetical protein